MMHRHSDLIRDRLVNDLASSEAELERLLLDHDRLIEASRSSNADDEHDPEGATIAFEREQLVAITARIRQTVAELRRALAELEGGTYGICETCSEPIDAARLDVRPQATRCITCALQSSRRGA